MRRVAATASRRTLMAPQHQTAVMWGIHQTTNNLLYSTSQRSESALIVGGIALASTAVTLKYALAAYEKYEASKPPPGSSPETDTASSTTSADSENTTKATEAEDPASTNTAKASDTAAAAAAKKKKGETAGQTAAKQADSLFASWFARNFYDGGFEDKMTKREAALILGIRESATVDKVKEAHRRVLLLNHPDRGGSAFLAAKINEAKDLLLKGRV